MTMSGAAESNFEYLVSISKLNPSAATWYQLGQCYFEGKGCDKNLIMASFCFLSCIELNKDHVYALNNLGITLFIRGTDKININKANCPNYSETTDPLLKKAFHYYTEAIRVNELYARAWYNLGNCHEFGYGTIQNLQQALRCYIQATNCGINFSPAWKKLFVLSTKGINMSHEQLNYCLKMSQIKDPNISDGLVILSKEPAIPMTSNSQLKPDYVKGFKKIRISGLSSESENDFSDSDISTSEDSLENRFNNLTIYKRVRKNAATHPILPRPNSRSNLSVSLPLPEDYNTVDVKDFELTKNTGVGRTKLKS